MIQEVFYWLFSMSITASIVAVPVILLRLIKPIPRRLSVFLWGIPFLRMVLPFGMNSAYSLMSLLSRVSQKSFTVYKPSAHSVYSFTNFAQAADTYNPITYKVDILEHVFGIGSVIWLMGTVVIFCILASAYCLQLREAKRAVYWQDRLYVSKTAAAPAVYGIIKPRIVFPEHYKNRDIHYIVLHEKAHIRRMDNLWRLLAFAVTAIHWFNPFCWIFLKLFLADLELACDECVLKKLAQPQRKAYALSLLDSKAHAKALTSAFGGAKLHKRIRNILSFKEMTRFSTIVFSLLIIAIFYMLLTNAG